MKRTMELDERNLSSDLRPSAPADVDREQSFRIDDKSYDESKEQMQKLMVLIGHRLFSLIRE